MANRNYIPSKGSDRQLWFDNFRNYVQDNGPALGLTPGDVTVVTDAYTTYFQAYEAAQTASTRSPVTIAALVTADNAMGQIARTYAQIMNNSPAVTDAHRAGLQINIRTVRPFARVAAPTTWPVLGMRSVGPLLHTLQYRDSSFPSDSKVRSKPYGASAMALYQHVGATPPADPATANFLGLYTRQPAIVELDPASVGQTAYYYARWVTARGLEGPLVGPLAATVSNHA